MPPGFTACWRCTGAAPAPAGGETLFGAILIIIGAAVLFFTAPLLGNLASALLDGRSVQLTPALKGIGGFVLSIAAIASGISVACNRRSNTRGR